MSNRPGGGATWPEFAGRLLFFVVGDSAFGVLGNRRKSWSVAFAAIGRGAKSPRGTAPGTRRTAAANGPEDSYLRGMLRRFKRNRSHCESPPWRFLTRARQGLSDARSRCGMTSAAAFSQPLRCDRLAGRWCRSTVLAKVARLLPQLADPQGEIFQAA